MPAHLDMAPKDPSLLPGGHFVQRGFLRRSCERCSITFRLPSQLAFATARERVRAKENRQRHSTGETH